MNFPKVLPCAIVAFALLAAAAASAQQKFPLRQGEWKLTTPDPTQPNQPFVLNYCLNDQTWARSLSNSTCTASNLTRTATGLTYNLTCNMKTLQMSGTGIWTFDGMEHISVKSVTTVTMNGKSNTNTTTADFRWKAAACSPNDLNLRVKPAN